MIARLALFGLLALHLRAQDLQSFLVNGSQALSKGANAEAEADFRRALALQPNSVAVLNNLAIALARQGKTGEAADLYRRALRTVPGDSATSRNLAILYFRTRQYQQAWPLLQVLAGQSSDFQLDSLAGLTLFALDRYAESARYLERAERVNPTDLATLDMLGKAYLRTNNYPGVTRVFGQILQLNPNSAQAHLLMGIAYDRQLLDTEAQTELEAARSADPRYPGVHSALGQLYWRQGNPDLAAKEFKTELRFYPDDPISLYTLGTIELHQNQPADAAVHLEKALTANPGSEETMIALGKARLALHQSDAAAVVLRQAVQKDDSSYQAHYLLGTALRQLGQLAEAKEHSAKARDLQAAQRAAYAGKLGER